MFKLKEKANNKLFMATGKRMRLHPVSVEKDYWVCFVINYLFNECKFKEHFCFKGGTSLSKCFNVIQRFSEDVDVVLDWRLIGYGTKEPFDVRSNRGQLAFNKGVNAKGAEFYADVLVPQMRKDLAEMLSEPGFSVYVDPDDPMIVCFKYRSCLGLDDDNPYIAPVVRLEIGPLAAWMPSEVMKITPYVYSDFPQVFEGEAIEVRTAKAERTFWEKTTILHREANRPQHKAMNKRYARHYYDLYALSRSPYKESAFANAEMLEVVVDFNRRFYPIGWANMDLCTLESIKLVPPDYRVPEIEADYEKTIMQMMWGDKPTMSEILEEIAKLEAEIHALAKSK